MPVLYNKRYGPALDIGFAYLVSMPGLGNMCFSEALTCTAIYQISEPQDTLEDHITMVKGILSQGIGKASLTNIDSVLTYIADSYGVEPRCFFDTGAMLEYCLQTAASGMQLAPFI